MHWTCSKRILRFRFGDERRLATLFRSFAFGERYSAGGSSNSYEDEKEKGTLLLQYYQYRINNNNKNGRKTEHACNDDKS